VVAIPPAASGLPPASVTPPRGCAPTPHHLRWSIPSPGAVLYRVAPGIPPGSTPVVGCRLDRCAAVQLVRSPLVLCPVREWPAPAEPALVLHHLRWSVLRLVHRGAGSAPGNASSLPPGSAVVAIPPAASGLSRPPEWVTRFPHDLPGRWSAWCVVPVGGSGVCDDVGGLCCSTETGRPVAQCHEPLEVVSSQRNGSNDRACWQSGTGTFYQ